MTIKTYRKTVLRSKQGKVTEATLPSTVSIPQSVVSDTAMEDNSGHSQPLPFQINTVHRSQQQLLLTDLWFGWSDVFHLSDDLIKPLAAAEL